MAENITAHMDKSLESLKHNFSKVRTGRANANILSDITVDYYGVPTPVTQVAAVKTPEAHMLLIEPWDKALINAIVKAIGASDLGITPNSDGTVVRLPFPAPTEERRRELVKECREYAEQAKVSIRNIRRDFNNKLERDEELTEDAVRQIALDAAAGKIDPGAIDDDMVASHLYTAGLPDPELVIRTSGELRLSNYLLWQVAYSEFYVTDTYWPDFDRWGLVDAILAYQGRDRRFGGLSKTEEA